MQPRNVGQCRWMIRRDMDEVLEIEEESFPCPWTREEFVAVLTVPSRKLRQEPKCAWGGGGV